MLNNDEYQMLESGVGVDENNKKLPKKTNWGDNQV